MPYENLLQTSAVIQVPHYLTNDSVLARGPLMTYLDIFYINLQRRHRYKTIDFYQPRLVV